MYHPIYPLHKRPLVVRTGVDYRFTTIAVDLVDAADGRYEVLFLGTGIPLCYLPIDCIRALHQEESTCACMFDSQHPSHNF